MAYPQFGSLGLLSGARPGMWGAQPPMNKGPVSPAMPVHPAWGINPPQFKYTEAMQNPIAPVQPAWGAQPPMWGGGAAGLANHLASLRQMNFMPFSPARSPRFTGSWY